MPHKYHKISLNHGESYIDSSKWVKNIKSTINPKNNDEKCFQCAITVALNYQNIKCNTERMSKTKPFIDQYRWRKTGVPSRQRGWKKFQSNNKTTSRNILYIHYNREKIRHAYISKHTLACSNQIVLLIITNGGKWDYFAVKSLSVLGRGKTSKNNGDFFCLKWLHSLRIETNLKSVKMYIKIMIVVIWKCLKKRKNIGVYYNITMDKNL